MRRRTNGNPASNQTGHDNGPLFPYLPLLLLSTTTLASTVTIGQTATDACSFHLQRDAFSNLTGVPQFFKLVVNEGDAVLNPDGVMGSSIRSEPSREDDIGVFPF